MEEPMSKVYAFQSALRTLEALVNWFLIWIPGGLAGVGVMAMMADNKFEVAIPLAVGTVIYMIFTHFIKTLSLGMAYTLVAIADNTAEA